jgi:hypothetical protein
VVAVELCMGVEIEPIRVDAKLDIVETEAEPGTKSRIHNLAYCWPTTPRQRLTPSVSLYASMPTPARAAASMRK